MEDKIIIYQTSDGQTQLDVRFENETVWLSANQMSILFAREESNIRRHIITYSGKENSIVIITCNFYTLMA